MEKLKQRSDTFTIVLNDSGADLFKSASYVLNKFQCCEVISPIYVAVIKHDKDTNDYGDLVTVHYHVVIQTPYVMRLSTMLNCIVQLFNCRENQISIDKCNSIIMQSRYLIHLDDVDKYQYNAVEVHSNNIELFNKYLKHIKKINDVDDLIAVVKAYPSLLELMSVLGIENYKKYRTIIRDIREVRF